jgi:hypothetical protein
MTTFTEANPTGKTYLGDGAYVHFDGYHIVLTTSDGIRTTNEVCMEPAVIAAFEHWCMQLRALADREPTP